MTPCRRWSGWDLVRFQSRGFRSLDFSRRFMITWRRTWVGRTRRQRVRNEASGARQVRLDRATADRQPYRHWLGGGDVGGFDGDLEGPALARGRETVLVDHALDGHDAFQ